MSGAPAVGIRVIGPTLDAEDVAERLEAIDATYSSPGDPHVVVADGFGLRVSVDRGALVVADGVGEHRRMRRFDKVSAPARLVVRGDGVLSTEALAWCRAKGTAVVVLGSGELTLAASPPGRDDARLRRAQALAPDSGAGLVIVRRLLGAKLRGQGAILRELLEDPETAGTLEDLAGGVEVAGDVDEARQLEATGAAAYFSRWSGHSATAVRFLAKDRHRVPPHWCIFDSRRSAITGAANTNRSAERPINALLNYTYRLAEIEARFALVRLGLDPGLGVLHTDTPGRDSLALDVLEPLRPEVDRFVLGLVVERPFRKVDFVERADGHVRVAGPLAHELAATLATWRKAVGPWAEAVAHLLADQVAGKITVSTPLTGSRQVIAQAEVRRRKAAEAKERAEALHSEHRLAQPVRRPHALAPGKAAVALARCVECGGPLTRTRHVRCEACWDRTPAQSREVRRRRGRSIAAARSELDQWRAEHPHAHARPEDFAPVREALRSVTLRAIMAECEVSKATASGWRAGRHVPHLRFWPALANLAGVVLDPDVAAAIDAGVAEADVLEAVAR